MIQMTVNHHTRIFRLCLKQILTSALIANGGADVRKMMECAKQRVTTPKGVTPANVSRDITKTLLDSVKVL